MENTKKGRLERIGAILSNRGAFWLAMSLVMLFYSLNTGPFEYAMSLAILASCVILGMAMVGAFRPDWTAFQQGNRIWLNVGVVVAANFAAVLPYHPHVWSALKYQAFMVAVFCVCVMYEFFKTDGKVVDDRTDEEASLIK